MGKVGQKVVVAYTKRVMDQFVLRGTSGFFLMIKRFEYPQLSPYKNLTLITPRQVRGFCCLLLFFILQAECAPPVDATPWSFWELGLTTEQGT